MCAVCALYRQQAAIGHGDVAGVASTAIVQAMGAGLSGVPDQGTASLNPGAAVGSPLWQD